MKYKAKENNIKKLTEYLNKKYITKTNKIYCINMANTINWGRIYCFTEFGDEDNTIAESIPSFSSPECFYCH